MEKNKVAIIMGSDSDLPVVEKTIHTLKDLGIPFEAHVMSAHRTPEEACTFARTAAEKGFGVIIAAAGKAAHLAGVLAGHTPLPVIGMPVATVAIDGAENAGLLAAQMLAISDESLFAKLQEKKEQMRQKVIEKDKKLQEKLQG